MLIEIFNVLTNSLLSTIGSLGYFGIFVLMTIESSLIPFPSEVVLIPAGALISQGKMSFILVFIASLLGSLTGAFFNYFLALYIGRPAFEFFIDNYGKFLLLNKSKLKKTDAFFIKHGEITTFVGRLIPVIRQLISLPAGFTKMDIKKFALFTALGAGIWSFILIYIGILFGNNLELIKQNLNSLTYLLILISAIIIVVYLIIYKKRKLSSHK